jgi:hypothetical protein
MDVTRKVQLGRSCNAALRLVTSADSKSDGPTRWLTRNDLNEPITDP